MELFPEQIRDFAVRAVEQYINEQTPLSASIADIVVSNKLNTEQIKRIVEATNQICYLKLQQMTQDRTFEFPLASSEEVEHLVLSPGMAKSASEVMSTTYTAPRSPLDLVAQINSREVLEKQAGEDVLSISPEEARGMLVKHAFQLKARLDVLKSESEGCLQKLASLGEKVRADKEGLVKLASVADTAYEPLCRLVTGKVEKVEGHGFYKKAELENTVALCNEYARAKTLVSETAQVQSDLEAISEALEKQAFVGVLAGLAARGLGTAARYAGKAAVGTVKGVGKLTGKKTVMDKAGLGLDLAQAHGEHAMASANKPSIYNSLQKRAFNDLHG